MLLTTFQNIILKNFRNSIVQNKWAPLIHLSLLAIKEGNIFWGFANKANFELLQGASLCFVVGLVSVFCFSSFNKISCLPKKEKKDKKFSQKMTGASGILFKKYIWTINEKEVYRNFFNLSTATVQCLEIYSTLMHGI